MKIFLPIFNDRLKLNILLLTIVLDVLHDHNYASTSRPPRRHTLDDIGNIDQNIYNRGIEVVANNLPIIIYERNS